MLNWSKQFNIFCFLDNSQYAIQPHQFECILAAGVEHSVCTNDPANIDSLLKRNEWTFGHLSYELNHQLFSVPFHKEEKIGFPLYYFFTPKILLRLSGHSLIIKADDPEYIFSQLQASPAELGTFQNNQIRIQQGLTKQQYLQKIQALKQHIQRGDCYEINFCQEFFAENVVCSPHILYDRLAAHSPNPFSALYRYYESYLVCASPERYLTREGERILSQPMKGTIRRDRTDAKHDEQLKQQLKNSDKDQSENVMVVDMVRNDLAKVCEDGSVVVDELFGVYSYPQVHQMISTISGQLKEGISFSEIIGATFPMGSMTGAPKKRVMELIEEYELQARGIFSGSVGYLAPGGNFDFNVVIRSILYNAANGYLSYQVGSGITFYSDPESEWEECLLKGEAIKKVLTS